MKHVTKVAKALSDGNRLRVIMLLKTGDLCLCQIIAILGLAPSTVSEHMSVLTHCGLASARRQGRWMFYGLPQGKGSRAATEAIRWVVRAVKDDPRVRLDRRRLAAIRRIPIKDLCKCYRPKHAQLSQRA